MVVAVVAVLLLLAALSLARERSDRATGVARVGLLLSLTVATGLVFCLDQFLAAVVAAVQLTLLVGLERFERRSH